MNRDLAAWVNRTDDVDELREIAEQLAPDARAVLLFAARRALVGQKQYGTLRLDADPREMKREALEETVDATFYLSCELTKMLREDRNG